LIAIAAIIGVLSVGVLAGVAIGVALSLVWLVYVTTAPPIHLLAREPGTGVFRELGEGPGDETFPGIAVVRLDAGLFFSTADALPDRLREIAQASDPPLKALVLDFAGVDFIDSQGAAKLTEIQRLADSYEITVRISRVKANVLRVLEADGALDALGAEYVHGNINQAVQAQLEAD